MHGESPYHSHNLNFKSHVLDGMELFRSVGSYQNINNPSILKNNTFREHICSKDVSNKNVSFSHSKEKVQLENHKKKSLKQIGKACFHKDLDPMSDVFVSVDNDNEASVNATYMEFINTGI